MKQDLDIRMTDFALRHFDRKFGGTKILDMDSAEFMATANFKNAKIVDGYAPFCKIAFIKNFTKARVGSTKITLANYQYLRSGYSSRTKKELPVFSRWFELPLAAPRAYYLAVILYDKEQLLKEDNETGAINDIGYEPFTGDFGIVAILGQQYDQEEPMKPATMLRNALGTKEGGSGHKIDRDEYLKAVKFWEYNATIK